MKLTIQTTDKAEHAVELGGAAPTVGELRAEVKQTLGAPDCTMVHRGTVLADDAQSLAATGVEDGGKIVVIIKKPKTVQPPLCAPRLHAPASPASRPSLTFVRSPLFSSARPESWTSSGRSCRPS